MFKLIFIATLIVYAVSIPLDDKSNPPKDDSKDLIDFISDGPDEHSVIKRHSNIAAGRVFALRSQNGDNPKNPKTKRDTGGKTDTNPPKLDDEPGARKVRDVSKEQLPKKDQHRVARDTTKDGKPKRIARDLPDTSQPIPQPPKQVPITKRDISKEEDPKKHIDTADDDKQRKIRSADGDKDKPSDHKPKRDTGKDNSNKHIDKDDVQQRKTRSTDDKNGKIPEHKSKRDTGKDDSGKHIDKDDNDHQRKSRAATDDKNKTPDQKKPKREAKESKPDAKKQPSQKSGSTKGKQ